jgi:hypothetical protein
LYNSGYKDNQQPSGDLMTRRLSKEEKARRAAIYNRKWQLANPDKTRAAQARWKARHPGKAAKASREWYRANRKVAQARERARAKAIKDEVYAAYGGYKCNCCGETNPFFLSMDHVNNDGSEHRRKDNVMSKKIYWWLKKHGFPKGFQVLCMNCNWGKSRNNGICPHQSLKAQRLPKASRKRLSK